MLYELIVCNRGDEIDCASPIRVESCDRTIIGNAVEWLIPKLTPDGQLIIVRRDEEVEEEDSTHAE